MFRLDIEKSLLESKKTVKHYEVIIFNNILLIVIL